MGASASFESALLNHIFVNLPIPPIGDSTGLQASATAGSLFVSLHTADPEAGDQTTNECTYTGYKRTAVARSTAGWIVSSSNVHNAAAVTFDACSGGSNTVTHFGVGASSSSTGLLIVSSSINGTLAVSNGITPSFALSELDCQVR